MGPTDILACHRPFGRGDAGAWLLACTAFAVLGVMILAARPAPAVATTLVRMPIEAAARRASAVIVGTVVGTQVEQRPDGVRTAVRLWVDESLKGGASGLATVYVPGGGLPDGSSVAVDSMASFAPGEVCCVFTDERGWVLGGYQGKVHLGTSALGAAAASQSAAVGRVRAALADQGPAAARAPAPEQQAQAPSSVSVAVAQPAITSVTPGSASAGTHSVVTIAGSGFGSAPGKVEFALNVYGVEHLAANEIVSWSDAEIVCVVPTGKVGGSPVTAGSGPLIVTDQNGSQSNPYDFGVPFGYAAAKWPTPQASYLLNPGGEDAAQRELFVDAGASTWSAARSAFAFADGGLTSASAAKDGSNVICWSETVPDGIVAITRVYASATGTITECDIQLNDEISWGDGVAIGTTDVQTIALHEFGHWLCLLDQYAVGDVDKVMYGFEVAGQRRELTQGEISGIRWIYPAPSGTLRGTVQDTAGVPLAGARVAVETCEPVVSGLDGSFVVPGIPDGSHQVVCSSPGYTTQVLSATIVADETTDTILTLPPGVQMPIYRFYQRRNGSHFYTASVAERDNVVSTLSDYYTFEGAAYALNLLDSANAAPLYRFFNRKNGSHFYTVSPEERDSVIAKLSATYTFEGVAYLVSAAPSPVTVPAYRFFNRKNGSHFYTTSPAEKNLVIRDLGATYTYEGPAFWVAP